MSLPDVAEVRARVDRVHERLRAAGGDPAGIRLVAVTKGFGPEVVELAVAAGLVDLGENYAQELVAKSATRPPDDPVRWHFIGRLQRNKVRDLAGLVALWQSVDRIEVGREIARRAPGAAVLVQVNVTAEPGKGGADPAAVPGLVDELRDLGLDVRGVMAVGPTDPGADPAPAFAAATDLADRLELVERSFGMS
ncbi:MAG TPA: alanine racemase, partial [Acidimicrobiales bacterium]|nr:alanine racemase [Acidimicrobiales bacterium]